MKLNIFNFCFFLNVEGKQMIHHFKLYIYNPYLGNPMSNIKTSQTKSIVFNLIKSGFLHVSRVRYNCIAYCS